MCGIAGIVSLNGADVSTGQLKLMTDRMVHRGPDDDGLLACGASGIGMRRLSIIDVAGGHQPLMNEAGDLQLVLNGEIYNHVELRAQLVARGHSFRTASDAEVVLHLYEEKGQKALHDLNGMFAFALHDGRQNAMWVVRDRLGIKPLFYAVTRDSVVFASDITALRANYPTTVDPQQVVKYFALSYVPGTETVWRGVRKLPPAHYLWVASGKVEIERYWNLEGVGSFEGTLADAERELERLLSDAIRLELRSDVPLGAFLSGGLDSSSIVALAAEQVGMPLRTYTVAFAGKISDDAMFARRVAEQYRTAHVEIPMDHRDAATALDEILPMLDEPLSDSALIPAYWVSKAARQRGVKVLLNGAGGDEIFGGYSRHWNPRLGSPAWAAENIPHPIRSFIGTAWGLLQPDRGTRAADPILAWGATVSGVNFGTARAILRERSDYAGMLEAVRTEHASLASGTNGTYTQSRMQHDLKTYLPQDVLAVTDKATMAASVEGRVPLIDHRLVEFAFSLPTTINFVGGCPKGLFKRVMRNRLPADLVKRAKSGFNAPDEIWLKQGSGMDLSAELLEARSPILDQLVNPRALEAVLAKPDLRRASASMLFALYLFNRWDRTRAALPA